MELLRLDQLPSVEGTWNPKLPIKASRKASRCSRPGSGQDGKSEPRVLGGGSGPGSPLFRNLLASWLKAHPPPLSQRIEGGGDRG